MNPKRTNDKSQFGARSPVVVGWESTSPPGDRRFNSYLSSRGAHLHYEDLDLASLFSESAKPAGLDRAMRSPLEIVYLPTIRARIAALQQAFTAAIEETNYRSAFRYAYASKANAAEEVVRTILRTGVDYEVSSAVDIAILDRMLDAGDLSPNQRVLCNGFKSAGSEYARAIFGFRRRHEHVIPILEDVAELPPFLESQQAFEVGLRLKTYGSHRDQAAMAAADSRFGLSPEAFRQAAAEVEASPQLTFSLFHAMVGSQITDEAEFVDRLRPALELYAELKAGHPSLSIFDYGGGVPVAMTLDFDFDYAGFARGLLQAARDLCQRAGVAEPEILGEMGRYTVAEHGAHLFGIQSVKDNGSPYPWYIIDGSIMSSFPDSWALGEHFIVLPLNHLDKPFQQVRLGGITCDSDDVYPRRNSSSPLYLPVTQEELYVGFFAVGAYQEMLGGVGGSKHCVIPEADELIVDRAQDGSLQFTILSGQSTAEVLANLGYVTMASPPQATAMSSLPGDESERTR